MLGKLRPAKLDEWAGGDVAAVGKLTDDVGDWAGGGERVVDAPGEKVSPPKASASPPKASDRCGGGGPMPPNEA